MVLVSSRGTQTQTNEARRLSGMQNWFSCASRDAGPPKCIGASRTPKEASRATLQASASRGSTRTSLHLGAASRPLHGFMRGPLHDFKRILLPLKTAKSKGSPLFLFTLWNTVRTLPEKPHEPRLHVGGEQPSIALGDLTNLRSQHPLYSCRTQTVTGVYGLAGWDLRRRAFAQFMRKERSCNSPDLVP